MLTLEKIQKKLMLLVFGKIFVKRKEREGKNYRPAKPGDKDRPSQEALKRAQGAFKYRDPCDWRVVLF